MIKIKKIWNALVLATSALAFPAITYARLPLTNPAPNTLPEYANSPVELIIEVISILLTFAGLVAVLFIIIGGFRYIVSAGNEEQAEKGKKTLQNAIIGLVIIILSYVIVNVINTAIAP